MNRTEKAREAMIGAKLDAMLLTDLMNIRYASGFTGSAATVLLTRERSIILVDFRYVLQAGEECPGYEVIEFSSGDVLAAAADIVNAMGLVRLGFESEHVSFSTHSRLRRLMGREVRLVGVKQLVEKLRMVKDSGEIEKIRRAVKLVDDCFSHMLDFVRVGMTEREVALEIDVFLRKNGAEKQGFDTIAAAGAHAAFPHHKPTSAVVKRGQMLKLDYGALLDGYNSDITRTIFLGEPDQKQREVYGIVLAAQVAAVEAVRPGLKGKDIDAVARDYITEAGYGDNFGHGLGHSIGIDVHDGPLFTKRSEFVLVPGMVGTIEPGIYIEGWGGVRIEDDVVVTEGGCEVLTRSSKELIVV